MPESVDISPNNDNGVLKEVLQEGQGKELPPLGCKVKVHYTGTLTDGTKFDSSRDRGEPFEFDLGKGSVIKAWDIGVATMKKGERAILTCASEYAYGKSGSAPTIPPDATLKFDVEVLEWTFEDISPKKDGGIERIEIITPGEGYSNPNEGGIVEVKLAGSYEGRDFDVRDVTWTVGEGSEQNVIYGLDKAIEKFKKGESSRLRIKPQYAFGSKGSEDFNIPPNATVDYTVTLKTFEKAKESWALDSKEKLEQAKIFKDKGTNYFKQDKLKMAIKMYKKVLGFLEQQDPETAAEADSLNIAAHSNLALCYLKLNENFDAKDSATAALKLDPENVKALFRRGQALLKLGEAKSAQDDFMQCLKLDPKNTAAQTQLALCNKTLKDQLLKEKKVYANMFDKFAKMDAQREEIEKKKEPNVLSSVGEWGKEDREREPSEFEKENPNILLLNNTGEFKDM